MNHEVRRFNAWDKEGRLYILVESAPFGRDAEGAFFKAGPATVWTLTGAPVILEPTTGRYRIPKLGVVVSATRPSAPESGTPPRKVSLRLGTKYSSQRSVFSTMRPLDVKITGTPSIFSRPLCTMNSATSTNS
jgi:hypothetical protein